MRVYRRRSRLAGNEAAPSKSTATDSRQSNGVAAWKRRHEAARRVVPLDCGCPDPWPCRCSDPPLSEKMIDAGRDAALHILEFTNRVPLLEIEVLQALWRRGGDDRVLAELLRDLTRGQVA
jgi:hypothetical protein